MIFKKKLKKKPSADKTNQKLEGGSFRSNTVLDTRCRAITDKYEYQETLGEGKMGKVASARKIKPSYDKRDNPPPHELVALKSAIVKASDMHCVKALRREIDLLKELDHPNVVKGLEAYKSSDRNIHLAFQYCTGGNLYSRFPVDEDGQRVPFHEKDAAPIIYQLLSALSHMHASCICHRDVKFENIMYDSEDTNVINLIDFGAACKFNPGKAMQDPIGTVYTMAREVQMGKYTEKVDLWSVGVITYMMLSLTKPFYGESKYKIVSKIMKGVFRYYSPRWENVSSTAKSFINALIEIDPEKRLSAAQAMNHPWIKEFYPSEEYCIDDEKTLKILHDSIVKYSTYNEFKKIGLIIVAHQMETDHVEIMRKVFDTYDANKNGTISFPDFVTMMGKIQQDYNTDDLREIFHKITMDHTSKAIRYTEFLAMAMGMEPKLVTEDRLWRAFDRIDYEARGTITKEQLKLLMGCDYQYERINELWGEHDFGAGISFEEFVSFFDDFI